LSKANSRSQYEKLASILDALGDADALKILQEAKQGFKSGKANIKELNLMPRKYYRNLKKLNNEGIITSLEDKYRLTRLGELLHKMLFNDTLGLLLANHNFPEVVQKIGISSEITVIDDYKNLISLLVAVIDKSKSEILLATRYLDLGVIQSIVYALDRNVRLKTVTSEKIDFLAFIKLSGGFIRNIRPNLVKFSIGAANNFRSGDVLLSFVVIDEEITIFEIPNDKFRIAFISTDKKTVRVLSNFFGELWNQSRKLPLPTF
jgi:DNA-binding transcriptional ArsR family regulator